MIEAVLGAYAHMHGVDDNWLDYLTKFDDEFQAEGDLWNSRQEVREYVNKRKQTKISEQVARYLETHTLDETRNEFKAWFLLNERKAQEWKANIEKSKAKEEALGRRITPIAFNENEYEAHDKLLAQYLNFIFRNYQNKSYRKKCHLFIKAKTNAGKSRFLSWLKKMYRCYEYNLDSNDWQDDWTRDEDYDLIIIDELQRIQTLRNYNMSYINLMLDGRNKMKRRYIGEYQRQHTIPVIIVSNATPGVVFAREEHDAFNAFVGRIAYLQIEDDDQITIGSQYWDDGKEDFHFSS